MAINRFRRILPQLDPTFYSWQPQEYLPDIEALGTVSTGLQGIYDNLDYLDIPKHLQEDVPSLQSMYIDPVEQMKEGAVEAFASGDTGRGIRQFKDIQRFLHRAKQPGGIYNQFEQSYQAYQDYMGQLDDLYTKGEISAERRDALKAMSRNAFEGSFNKEGAYNPFSGISAAFEQDRLSRGLEIGKGWKADKFPEGIFRTPQGYFRADTKERVNPEEVLEGVYIGLASDKAIMNDLRQEAMLRGYEGEAAREYIDKELKKVAATVAEKEGFEAVDSKFLKDWVYEENIKQRNRYKLEDYKYNLGTGEHKTRVYTVETGMPELNVKAGKIKIKDPSNIGTTFGIRTTTPRGATGGSKPEYIDKGFDQLIKEDPAFAEQNPALVEIVNQFGRKRDGNDVESDADYNKRIQKIYNKKRESLSTAYSVFEGYGPDRQNDRNQTVIGKGDKLGTIQHKKLWLTKPGQPPQAYSYEQAKKMLGLTDEEFIAKANVLGSEKTTTSILPSGEQIGVATEDGTYQFIVENISYGDEAHKRDIYALSQPLRDATINETPYYIVGGEKLKTKAVDIWSRDEQGNIILDEKGVPAQYRREVHVIGEDGSNLTLGLDKNGDPIINPETGKPIVDLERGERGITLEDLEQMNRSTNPYRTLDFNKSGERELERQVPFYYE